MRSNETDRYLKNFPYISLCGHERNYLKCDDLPFVITKLDENNDMIHLNQINSAHWSFNFDPTRLYHNLRSGRLYYLFEDKEIVDVKRTQVCHDEPGRLKHLDKLPCRIALVKSDISIRLMQKMHPIKRSDGSNSIETFAFEYKSKMYELNNDPACKASKLIEKLSFAEKH